jgi:hypothetical protein
MSKQQEKEFSSLVWLICLGLLVASAFMISRWG